jgi:hypothetical protein
LSKEYPTLTAIQGIGDGIVPSLIPGMQEQMEQWVQL